MVKWATKNMQPVLQQIRLLTGLNVGSKFATLVAAMLQNKLHVLVTQFTKALASPCQGVIILGMSKLLEGLPQCKNL